MAVKKKNKRIGFDFDKVFVSYPPIVPDKLIDLIYKGGVALKNKKNPEKIILSYRFPGKIEQIVRILSHHSFFRPPIKSNISYLIKIKKKNGRKLYLISSRFGFLKNKTELWMRKNLHEENFDKVFFNYKNSQPHIFKKWVINKLKITDYIDDDIDLLVFLSKHFPKTNFYWITRSNKSNYKSLPRNIFFIKDLKQFYNKYL